jgi:hypothetical protein
MTSTSFVLRMNGCACLVHALIDSDPNDDAADGVTVLEVWRAGKRAKRWASNRAGSRAILFSARNAGTTQIHRRGCAPAARHIRRTRMAESALRRELAPMPVKRMAAPASDRKAH